VLAAEVQTHVEVTLDWQETLTIRGIYLTAARHSEKVHRINPPLRSHYRAIDMRLTADGEYVFFEVTRRASSVHEIWTGQPMAMALAEYLVN
jgi:hypothetical protein